MTNRLYFNSLFCKLSQNNVKLRKKPWKFGKKQIKAEECEQVFQYKIYNFGDITFWRQQFNQN